MINTPIIIGGTKLPELTNPGVAGDLLAGKQLIDQYGNPLTGTIPIKSAADLTANGAVISVPAGYYPSAASKSVAAAVQATPAISVSNTGLITASAEQEAGYVAEGTKSATLQLTTQAAQTITPGTTNKTIASGRYLTGVQTIKGDTNLLAANIKSGVSIFGVEGTSVSPKVAMYNHSDMSNISITASGTTLTITMTDLSSASKILYLCLCIYKLTIDGTNVRKPVIVFDQVGWTSNVKYYQGKILYPANSTSITWEQSSMVSNTGNTVVLQSVNITYASPDVGSNSDEFGIVVYE